MVAASKFSTSKVKLCELTNSRQAILLIDAYAPAHAVPQKRAVFYFCSTFGCSLAVPRCRLKNARNARFAYETGERRLMGSDQKKSMISEF
jgi:hypothetical protein